MDRRSPQRASYGGMNDPTALSPMAVSPPPVVSLRTPGDLADLLPYLLGFFPDESIVALGLRGPRLRQGGTIRVDLPPPARWDGVAVETARLLAETSEQRGRRPDAVVLYLCHEPRGTGGGRAAVERLAPLTRRLEHAFGALGLPVREALCVSTGRWWSFHCTDSSCCPPEGTPTPRPGAASPVAAAAAYAGIVVRGSHREIAAALEPVAGPEAEAQRLAFAVVVRAMAPERRGPDGVEATRRRTDELVRTAVTRFRGGASRIPDEETARIVLGLRDKAARDRATEFLDGVDAAHAQRLWRFLAGRCVEPFRDHAAAPLTLLAWSAWTCGDTPTARVALQRALAADPGYTLARLLYEAVNAGLEPVRLLHAVRDRDEPGRVRGRGTEPRRASPHGPGAGVGPGSGTSAPE